MKPNQTFVKVAELSGEDRTKLRNYWGKLWGSEFAKALTSDPTTDGKKIQVEAKNKSVTK